MKQQKDHPFCDGSKCCNNREYDQTQQDCKECIQDLEEALEQEQHYYKQDGTVRVGE